MRLGDAIVGTGPDRSSRSRGNGTSTCGPCPTRIHLLRALAQAGSLHLASFAADSYHFDAFTLS